MDDPRMPKAAARLSMTPVDGSGPSVAVAQQWLRDVILPHRIRYKETGEFRLVDMGEDPTGSELFPLCRTSLKDLSVFGIGIGLYFRMLLELALLLLVLGAISAPTIAYFSSEGYSGELADRGLDIRIWGTAACTRVSQETVDISNSSSGSGNTTETLTVNDCPLIMTQLHVDMVGLGVLAIYCLVAGILQTRQKAHLDAQEQTPSDYSVVIKDPNANAWEPDEWERFFSQFGTVKFVTVCVNNHRLLSALAHKRYMEEMLKMESADPGVVQRALQDAADPAKPPPKRSCWRRMRQMLGLGPYDLEYWHAELDGLRRRIAHMLDHDSYRVWSVFVMFETEEGQRRCLRETRVGLCSTEFDSSHSNVPDELRFRGSNILQVEQAVEPTSVQWKSAGVMWRRRVWQQALSLSIVAAMMVGVYYLARWVKDDYVGDEDADEEKRRGRLYLLAYMLSVTDIMGCQLLSYVDRLEQHQTKEQEQLSTLNKLLIFRAFNGAVVLYLLMDFTDILSQENLLQIQALLIANLVTTPVLQLVSPYERFYRFYYGPKAKTQRKLNSYYSGAYWKLAERYTQITRSVGIALFFKSLLPTGMVITALSMLVNYAVDKYCLLRKWKTPPRYNGLLARASRYHLLLMALASLVMMGHWYNGWPFDQPTQRALEAARSSSSRLNQSIMYTLRVIFPFQRESYPTEEQTELMEWLVWIIFITTCITLGFLLLKSAYRAYRRYVVGTLVGSGFWGGRARMSEIPASQVATLNGYVPSYESWYSDFPLLSVPLDAFESRFISWGGDHKAYSLVDDVMSDPQLRDSVGGKPLTQLFGACKQYDLSGQRPARDHSSSFDSVSLV